MQLPFEFGDTKLIEYFFIIEPPLEVHKFVNDIKRELEAEFGNIGTNRSKPHLTVFKYFVTADRETKIFQSLKSDLSKIRSFKLNVRGFDSFAGANTLHLATEFPENFQLIQKSLRNNVKALRISKKGLVLVEKPHITIAKKLINPVFRELRSKYSKKIYERSFHVESLLVLRRTSAFENYTVYTKIPLR